VPDLDVYQLNNIINEDEEVDSLLGKRNSFDPQSNFDTHPLNALMIHNLN
jgi:hypothetical protein